MKKTILRTRSRIVRGSIMVVLLFTLFTMMSLTAFASDQHRQGSRSTLVAAPSGNAQLQWNPQTKALTVTLHVSGLQPRSNHAAHIHAGPCSREGKDSVSIQEYRCRYSRECDIKDNLQERTRWHTSKWLGHYGSPWSYRPNGYASLWECCQSKEDTIGIHPIKYDDALSEKTDWL